MRMRLLSVRFATTLVVTAAPASAQEKTLTVYTYESFTAEWGPGPAVEKAFEADLRLRSVEFVWRRGWRRELLNAREAGRRFDEGRSSCSGSTPT
jgi:ABC-type thiamine transport system substrate-binding protein